MSRSPHHRLRRPRSHRLLVGLAVAGIMLALAACAGGSGTSPPATSTRAPSPSATPSFPLTLRDDDGVPATLSAPPARIVTWGPSLTETLFSIGAGSRIVGVSGPYDDYPEQATHITHVGGSGGIQPDLEKVVSLRPDLVVNAFLGGQKWEQRLRELGIPVFSLYATTLDDALADIRTIGRLVGDPAAADRLVAGMSARASEVQRTVAGLPRVSCFLEEGFQSPDVYTVGPGSMEFDLLGRAGCDPVTAGDKSAYPAWLVESVVHADPAVYLVPTESGVGPDDVTKRPDFAGLAAVTEGRVYGISSDLLNRPGPRLVDGLSQLVQLLHPGA